MDRANFSIHVTPENVDKVITFVRAFGLNVEHIQDSLLHAYPYLGELYLILSVSSFSQQFTCVEMTPEEFFEQWMIHDNHVPNSFQMNVIERRTV